jgi:hypothetical protein
MYVHRFCREHYTAQVKEETTNNSLTKIIVEIEIIGRYRLSYEAKNIINITRPTGLKLCLRLWFIIADILKNLINV